MTSITIIFTDNELQEFTSNLDYESIVFWARHVVEYSINVKQIIVDFDEGRMIFEAIN